MNQNGLPSEYNVASHAPSRAFGFGFKDATRNIIHKVLGLVITRPVLCNFYSSGFVVDTEARQLIGASSKRRYLAIQNNSVAPVFIAFGATPSINGVNSFVLPQGAVFTFETGFVASNELRAVSSAPANVAIIEGVEVDAK